MKTALRHSFWLAPVLTLIGAISYFVLFVRFPLLRDFPWINLPLVLLGAAVAVIGLRRNWSSSSWLFRALHASGTVFSAGLAGLFCAYIFYLSYQMPEPAVEVTTLEVAPGFSLPSADGSVVSLQDFRGQRVVISFFRGFW